MTKPLHALSPDVMSSWHRFLDVFEPLRPELYRYCRHLTRNTWDAEDLAQDVLARAFVTLGTMFHEIEQPRAWLFRVASNLWIDRARRARRTVLMSEPLDTPSDEHASDPRPAREAAGALFASLSPQERAAVVLKDVFDFSLAEIAQMLSTSTGAVKAALHRGRGRLGAGDAVETRAPVPAALDAFCAAFNARDLDGLTALLLDGASVEIVGVVTEYGADEARDPRTGSFAGTLAPITLDERGGVAPELLEGYLGRAPRCEVRAYREGWVLLFWYDHTEGPSVRTVMSLDVDAEHVARVRNYFFTPDVIAEVCGELGVPYRINGYRYWHEVAG